MHYYIRHFSAYSIRSLLYMIFVFSFFTVGCKKLIEIDPPVDTITTDQVYSNDANALSAISAIYSRLINTGSGVVKIGSGALTIYGGLSSDELAPFSSATTIRQFYNNSLLPANVNLSANIWTPAYFAIYQANEGIRGIEGSRELSTAIKKQLLGECKFVRAFCNFYLVNLFGDIPLVLTTEWDEIRLLRKSSPDNVYQQIISDLKDAKDLLPADNSAAGDRVRPSKAAATALLARTYLYMNHWENAALNASEVLESSIGFKLESNPGDVFLKNSREAIWQLQQNNSVNPFSATIEGNILIPFSSTASPSYYLTNHLLAAFEGGDLRRDKWLRTTNYNSVTYSYPYKYQKRTGSAGESISEYYMVLRLAEQYLIRAEAFANMNNLAGAIADLDSLRKRAGLAGLDPLLTQGQVLLAVQQERRVELFAEWGHRWLDLKRTNKVNEVIAPVKGSNWQSTDQFYPIPLSEIRNAPNLIQNDGYK